jgi:hypothetical protein
MPPTDRDTFTQGLHHLADLLHDNPDLPLPFDGTVTPLTWFIDDDLDQALLLRAGIVDARTTRDAASAAFPVQITGSLGGIRVIIRIAAKIALIGDAPVPVFPPADSRLGIVDPARLS